MNKIIVEVLSNGIPIEMNMVDGKINYSIQGFYKSGECVLIEDDESEGNFIAHTRYGRETYVYCFNELVQLNYEWWGESKERLDGWAVPAEPWLSHMVALGLVTTETKTVTEVV